MLRDQRITKGCGKLYGREHELRALRSTIKREVVQKSPEKKEQQQQQENDHQAENLNDTSTSTTNEPKNEQQETIAAAPPTTTTGGANIVFVEGLSGTGKSALVNEAFQDNENCLFGSGKFDQRTAAEKPYAALMTALAEICGKILHLSNDQEQEQYKKRLHDNLGQDELGILSFMIPNLAQIVAMDTAAAAIADDLCCTKQTCCTASEKGAKEALEKLRYALRVFLCSVCTPELPVILFLDDLQWMDTATFELLKSILSNAELQHCVFVGSFRDNEVDESHIVRKWISCMEENYEGCGLSPPMRIHVGNLSVQHLAVLLADLLKAEQDSATKELTDLIHRKTEGNVFHVLQLLEFLQAEGLLEYSLSSYRWTWDVNKVRGRTSLSDNVVKIVLAKINRLTNHEKVLLKMCSCLGFRFDRHVLSLVCSSMATAPCLHGVDIEPCLEALIEDGLLETLGTERLKFAHDKVLQAATQLVPCDGDRANLHYNVGRILLDTYGLDDPAHIATVQDSILFLCVDQLDLGRDVLPEECRRKLAYLNLEVANRAASFSAFSPSADYLETAISLLNEDTRWMDESYKLSLEMFTSLAEMSYCAGRILEHKAAVAEVLKHSKSIDDSIRAYMAKIRCLLGENNYPGTFAAMMQAMEELGEPLPPKAPSTSAVNRDMSKLRKRLDSLDDSDILSLPLMSSTRKSAAVRMVCETLMPFEYDSKDRFKSVLCWLANTILDHGLAPDSAVVFGIIGYHYASEYDIDMAIRCTKLSKALLERPAFQASKCRAVAYCVKVRHWREPLSLLVDDAFENHRCGMQTGDLYTSFGGALGYSILFFYSGLPLGPLAVDLKKFCDLMFDYGQQFWGLLLVPTYQAVLNLTGKSENILDMSHGVAARYRKQFGWKNSVGEQSDWSFLMQIAFYCEDFKLARSLAEKLQREDIGITRGMFFDQARVFFFTLIAIQKVRKYKQRPLKQELARREAKKLYEVVHSWVVDNKSINTAHKLLILDAEMLSIQRQPQVKEDTLRAAYDKAIAASTRSGFLQDGALASQLASRAIPQEKEMYMERALDLYSSWGAQGLVEHLMKHPSRTLSDSSSSVSDSVLHEETPVSPLNGSGRSTGSGSGGTGFRSRQRFDARLAQAHKSLDVSDETANLSSSSNSNLSSYRSIASRASLYQGYGV